MAGYSNSPASALGLPFGCESFSYFNPLVVTIVIECYWAQGVARTAPPPTEVPTALTLGSGGRPAERNREYGDGHRRQFRRLFGFWRQVGERVDGGKKISMNENNPRCSAAYELVLEFRRMIKS